jgi:hypothetical protein
MGVPAHQATTRHLGAAYPFASEAGLGGRGVLIGRDLLGGAFVYDPFELYRGGALTKVSIKTGFRTRSALTSRQIPRRSKDVAAIANAKSPTESAPRPALA